MASTLTGEFSYTYGIGLARALPRLRLPRLCATGGLPRSGRSARAHRPGPRLRGAVGGPRRHLLPLLRAQAVANALLAAGPWPRSPSPRGRLTLLPLLADWGWTTPYDDPWITVTTAGLFPRLLWPLFAAAGLGVAVTLVRARRTGGPDHRLLFLAHAGLVGAALAAAGPALGVIDVRFVPFAQLSLVPGRRRRHRPRLPRARRCPTSRPWRSWCSPSSTATRNSHVLRYWIDWNYTGLEAKELWPAFRELADTLRGTVADPRVAVEYSADPRAGGLDPHVRDAALLLAAARPSRASTTRPASRRTPSTTSPRSCSPARRTRSGGASYSRFDPEPCAPPPAPLRRERRRGAERPARRQRSARAPTSRARHGIPPYTVFRLTDPGPGYVEPLAFAPVRSAWPRLARQGLPLVHPQAALAAPTSSSPTTRGSRRSERDEWLPPPGGAAAGRRRT